ncbi:MAG: hypothetical protein ICV83_23210 [Cytophagales bacterium]|nr:hypothetical protein [Cytophagales bacterium]
MKCAGWLLLGLAACSCTRQQSERDKSADTVAARPVSAATEQKVNPALVRTIQGLPLLEPEYKDTVRWNTPPADVASAPDLLDGLSLRSLTQGETLPKVFLLHRLNVSVAFYSVVVSYQPSEHELKNYLVTYSPNLDRIDTCLVAADEIAEGLLSAYSVINGNTIERHAFNYTNEAAPETIKRFVITDQGKIMEQ